MDSGYEVNLYSNYAIWNICCLLFLHCLLLPIALLYRYSGK